LAGASRKTFDRYSVIIFIDFQTCLCYRYTRNHITKRSCFLISGRSLGCCMPVSLRLLRVHEAWRSDVAIAPSVSNRYKHSTYFETILFCSAIRLVVTTTTSIKAMPFRVESSLVARLGLMSVGAGKVPSLSHCIHPLKDTLGRAPSLSRFIHPIVIISLQPVFEDAPSMLGTQLSRRGMWS